MVHFLEDRSMRRKLFARFLAITFILLSVRSICAAATESEFLEKSRVEWTAFLEKECPDDTSEQVVRKVMSGKYRDVGLGQSAGENHLLLFLLDDHHQIDFVFDRDNKLIFTPTIKPKEQWLRSPNGRLSSIPTEAERKMKAKAAQVAMDYVAQRTKHDSLKAGCWRSAKASTWVVLVNVDHGLAMIDSLGYHLEVTDDGQVK
jgi:hypothetical protein